VTRRAGTVVDSSVLLDVFTEDPKWAAWSERAMADALAAGPLVVNVIVLAEVAPRFSRFEDLEAAVAQTLVVEELPIEAAFLAGHAHANYRRTGGAREQVLPAFLIAAHAAVTGRALLTRDPRRVVTYLPGTLLITPP
jgi:predicted nucleic acid-binding protein